MREPRRDYSQPAVRTAEPAVGLRPGGATATRARPGRRPRGRCPALAECTPVRDGDRWRCNRSTLRGGPCDDGPTPEGGCGRVHRCQPVRSLRAMRGRFVTACTLLDRRRAVDRCSVRTGATTSLRPGRWPSSTRSCWSAAARRPIAAACHAAADDGASAAGRPSLVLGHGDVRPTQSQLCMKCHEKTIAARAGARGPQCAGRTCLRQITRTAVRTRFQTCMQKAS